MGGVYQGLGAKLPVSPVTIKILVNNNAKFEQTKTFSARFARSIVLYPTVTMLPPVIAMITSVR